MFELTKRRADTMNLVGEKLVVWSPSLPSPRCWMLRASATPSWWLAAVTHLDEYLAAGMLCPTTVEACGGRDVDDFVLVAWSSLGHEQWRQWREVPRRSAEDAHGGSAVEAGHVRQGALPR